MGAKEKLRSEITNHWKFGLYTLLKLPMGFLAGLRINKLTDDVCVTSVPFKNLNKNPFKSIYFAVQSMAAELSTAAGCMLAVQEHKPSVAFIIVDMKASFHKKATSKVFFECQDVPQAFEAVKKAVDNKTAETATFKTVGTMKDGTVVSEFEFTWSFKQRSS